VITPPEKSLQNWKPTRAELLFAICCTTAWSLIFLFLPPALGGTDVYLFRDPACNFLAGKGFVTASYEHSHSFQPVLYSIYTPGSLWVFMLFAKVFGCGIRTAKIYPLLWSLPADVAVFIVGLRFLNHKTYRWLFLILWAAILPVGIIPAGDRPEPVSFFILLLLFLILRKRPSLAVAAIAGIVGGAASLSQPFAGVVACLLIAAWLLSGLLLPPTQWPSVRSTPGAVAKSTVVTTFAATFLAAIFFALPVAVTAISFYRIDNQSLQRFLWQAKYGSLERTASYSTIETGPNAVPHIAERPGTLKKYTDAAKAHLSLGALHLFIYVAAGVMFIAWLYCLLRATGPLAARCSLVIVGFAFFIVPVVVFPMQYNYLVLTSALFPLLLGFNMAGIRTVLRNDFVIPVLLVADILCVLPSFIVRVVQSVESRASYKFALQQADTLRDYLSQHTSIHDVVLVPATHYFLYKDVADKIYNPNYLSASHDPDQVSAVVNCYEGTKNFVPGTLPLPDFVSKLRWRELSAARDPLSITLFRHKVMSRDWSLECDIYVRDEN
jgi:hypothetical protein